MEIFRGGRKWKRLSICYLEFLQFLWLAACGEKKEEAKPAEQPAATTEAPKAEAKAEAPAEKPGESGSQKYL